MHFLRHLMIRTTAVAVLLGTLTGCGSSRPEPYVFTGLPGTPSAPRDDAFALPSDWELEAPPPRVGGVAAEREAPVRGYRLRSGDPVTVQLRGIPEAANFEFIIDDSGFVQLPYIDPIRAEGMTTSQLQSAIHRAYTEGRIYRQVAVNVLHAAQSYYVRGEVRSPGRYQITSGLTLVRALAAAGGYTEHANARRVDIIRGGETITFNARDMEQNPEQDIEVKVGDVIIVRRGIW